jgi:hypothetical protein
VPLFATVLTYRVEAHPTFVAPPSPSSPKICFCERVLWWGHRRALFSTSHSHDVDKSPSVPVGVQPSPRAEHGRPSTTTTPSSCCAAYGTIATRYPCAYFPVRSTAISPSKPTCSAAWQSTCQAPPLAVRQRANSATQPKRYASRAIRSRKFHIRTSTTQNKSRL